MIVRLAGADARRALTFLEESAAGAAAVDQTMITTDMVERAVDKALSATTGPVISTMTSSAPSSSPFEARTCRLRCTISLE